ncbi:hypothetical protein B0H19DRAFT_1171788 [Mycena capillaripes]|nr:hypothetical protein B0H19DRAFT_1171788 [Mycena capillaripes]
MARSTMLRSTASFPPLLVSNEALHLVQISLVQEILQNKKAELSDLAADISKLQHHFNIH